MAYAKKMHLQTHREIDLGTEKRKVPYTVCGMHVEHTYAEPLDVTTNIDRVTCDKCLSIQERLLTDAKLAGDISDEEYVRALPAEVILNELRRRFREKESADAATQNNS